MNLNPFAKKVDMSNPYDLYPLVYTLSVTPKLFAGKKEFVKELSKLVGPKFEHCIYDVPLIFNNTQHYPKVEDLLPKLEENSRSYGRISGVTLYVIGDQFKKLFESPKAFDTFNFNIEQTFDTDSLWWPLYERTVGGYYTAARMQSEIKAPIKGLPLTCTQCNSVFVADSCGDDESELDSSGCCENCGSLQAKFSDEILSKAYVYVRESEKKLGVLIFRTDY